MEKLNFDIEKYQSLTPAEKVEALSKIFFKYLDEGFVTEDLSDEEIEGIYSMTIRKIYSLFVHENDPIDDGFKLKFFHDKMHWYNEEKNISLSDEEYWDLPKDFTIFDFFGYRNYSKYDTDGSIDRTKVGYKVFSNFKNIVKSKNKVLKPKLSNPEKIAVLYEIGIESTLNKFSVTEDKYRFIHELIGGDYSNIKKVMISGVSNQNKRAALEFINSKTI